MVTDLGKMLRKIRIDNDQHMKDMANVLGITKSYLSMIELGKRNMPDKMIDLIIKKYNLKSKHQHDLKSCAKLSMKTIKIDLSKIDDENLKNIIISYIKN